MLHLKKKSNCIRFKHWNTNIKEFIKNFQKKEIKSISGYRRTSVIWFGFFVSWHINLCRLFNAKAILLEEQ